METKIVPHKNWTNDQPYWKVFVKKTSFRVWRWKIQRWECVADMATLEGARLVERQVKELENV